jgi:hypothetical protein
MRAICWCVVPLISGVAGAADITSTYTAATGSWNDPGKWSSNPQFPHNADGLTYDAVLANAGAVTLNQDVILNKYTFSSGTTTGTFNLTCLELLTWNGGTFSGSGTTNANGGLAIGGGTKLLSARTIANPTAATWTAGLIDGAGVINNLSGATFDISHDASMRLATFHNNGTLTKSAGTLTTVFENCTFNNNSSLTWSAGNLQFKFGGTFNNAGVFDLKNDATFSQQITPHTTNFNNTGVFKKTGGLATATVSANVLLNNQAGGSVQVNSGTLALNAGGTHAGSFTVASGSTLSFGGGNHTFQAASSISGAGNVVFTGTGATVMNGGYNVTGTTALSGNNVTFGGAVTSVGSSLSITAGVATLNSSFAVDTLNVSGGTMGGSGIVTVASPFNWTGGTMTGTGSTVASGGLTISGTGARLLSRTLTNGGASGLWSGGAVDGLGTLQNNAGATLAINHDASLRLTTLANFGTVNKTAGTSNAIFENPVVNNNAGGVINWSSGNLQFKFGGTINNAGLFDLKNDSVWTQQVSPYVSTINNSGTFAKSAGGGTASLAPLITFNNTGVVEVRAGTLQIDKPLQHSGTTLAGGAWRCYSGGILSFPNGSSITTIGPTASVLLSGAGSTFGKINGVTDVQGGFAVESGRNFTTPTTLALSGALGAGTNSTLTVTGLLTATGGASVGGAGNVVALAGANVSGTVTKTGSGALDVRSATGLNLAAGAKLDVTGGKVIVRSGTVGTATGGVYTGWSGKIQAGYNGGAWNGAGIMTSTPDAAGGLTSLGIATAGDAGYTTFSGVSVAASDVLLFYTYAGDANLDGQVTGDDYSAIDFNILLPNSSGWYNGDFNYDGHITGDDYSAIDFNLLAQGPPFSTASPASPLTAVPEPAAGCILLAAATTLRRRRNRL